MTFLFQNTTINLTNQNDANLHAGQPTCYFSPVVWLTATTAKEESVFHHDRTDSVTKTCSGASSALIYVRYCGNSIR